MRLVKWHPCPHGLKACFNELVASRLGQLIDSPILRGGVVYVPDDIIPPDHRPIGQPGFHFAVTRMQGQNFVPAQHYSEIENSSQLAAAAVHLTWLHVEDQHGHNQFLQRLETGGPNPAPRESRILRLIDMGFMYAQPNWDARTLAALPDRYALPAHLSEKLTMPLIDAVLSDLSAVPEVEIRSCFSDVPDEWGVSTDDATAGATRAVTIRGRLRDLITAGNPQLATRN